MRKDDLELNQDSVILESAQLWRASRECTNGAFSDPLGKGRLHFPQDSDLFPLQFRLLRSGKEDVRTDLKGDFQEEAEEHISCG